MYRSSQANQLEIGLGAVPFLKLGNQKILLSGPIRLERDSRKRRLVLYYPGRNGELRKSQLSRMEIDLSRIFSSYSFLIKVTRTRFRKMPAIKLNFRGRASYFLH